MAMADFGPVQTQYSKLAHPYVVQNGVPICFQVNDPCCYTNTPMQDGVQYESVLRTSEGYEDADKPWFLPFPTNQEPGQQASNLQQPVATGNNPLWGVMGNPNQWGPQIYDPRFTKTVTHNFTDTDHQKDYVEHVTEYIGQSYFVPCNNNQAQMGQRFILSGATKFINDADGVPQLENWRPRANIWDPEASKPTSVLVEGLQKDPVKPSIDTIYMRYVDLKFRFQQPYTNPNRLAQEKKVEEADDPLESVTATEKTTNFEVNIYIIRGRKGAAAPYMTTQAAVNTQKIPIFNEVTNKFMVPGDKDTAGDAVAYNKDEVVKGLTDYLPNSIPTFNGLSDYMDPTKLDRKLYMLMDHRKITFNKPGAGIGKHEAFAHIRVPLNRHQRHWNYWDGNGSVSQVRVQNPANIDTYDAYNDGAPPIWNNTMNINPEYSTETPTLGSGESPWSWKTMKKSDVIWCVIVPDRALDTYPIDYTPDGTYVTQEQYGTAKSYMDITRCVSWRDTELEKHDRLSEQQYQNMIAAKLNTCLVALGSMRETQINYGDCTSEQTIAYTRAGAYNTDQDAQTGLNNGKFTVSDDFELDMSLIPYNKMQGNNYGVNAQMLNSTNKGPYRPIPEQVYRYQYPIMGLRRKFGFEMTPAPTAAAAEEEEVVTHTHGGDPDLHVYNHAREHTHGGDDGITSHTHEPYPSQENMVLT